MAANEFEKNIRGLMDDFKLQPSGEVWPRVESEIREKKKRRRIIFALFFGALGLAIASYFVFTGHPDLRFANKGNTSKAQGSKTSGRANHQQNATTATEQPSPVGGKPAAKMVGSNGQPLKPSVPGKASAIIATTLDEVRPTTNHPETTSNSSADAGVAGSQTRQPGSGRNPVSGSIDQPTAGVANTTEQNISATGTSKPTAGLRPNIDAIGITMKATYPQNATGSPVRLTLTDGLTSPIVDAIDITNKFHRHVEFGISAFIGTSRMVSSLPQALALDPDKSYQNSFAANPGTPGPPVIRNTQQSGKAAVALSIGATARWRLSKRTSLQGGLAYTQLSDNSLIGDPQALTIPASYRSYSNTYYAGAAQHKYVDRFHLLTVPVSFRYAFVTTRKSAFAIYAGASLSYMMSSNALIYDTAALGIYYRNTELIPKTAWNVFSGLSYQVDIRGAKLEVGPEFNMGLTKIIKAETDRRKYFAYRGIRASFSLEKKKHK